MGLCRCRKVTNLFCFECRKNVCETCMVADHPHCIVRSYLEWLGDSDVRKECVFCEETVVPSAQDAFRLTCYEFAHVTCFKKYIDSMPRCTAPAGYVCKSCKTPLFPVDQCSPVALDLRQTLIEKDLIPSTVAWTIEGVERGGSPEPTAPKSAADLGGWDTLEQDLSDSRRAPTEAPFAEVRAPASQMVENVNTRPPAVTKTSNDLDSVQAKLDEENIRSFLNRITGQTPMERKRRQRYAAGALTVLGGWYFMAT